MACPSSSAAAQAANGSFSLRLSKNSLSELTAVFPRSRPTSDVLRETGAIGKPGDELKLVVELTHYGHVWVLSRLGDGTKMRLEAGCSVPCETYKPRITDGGLLSIATVTRDLILTREYPNLSALSTIAGTCANASTATIAERREHERRVRMFSQPRLKQ